LGRPCTVCTHPRHAEIDKALIDGEAIRGLGKTFNLSRQALQRHRDDHLSRLLATSALPSMQGEVLAPLCLDGNLPAQLAELERKAAEWHKKAENIGDLRGGLLALRELARLKELRLRALQLAGGADPLNGNDGIVPNYVVILPSNGRADIKTSLEDEGAGGEDD
jgi:hypothetical protein